ncbi:hypothetical protein [Desulfovibrio ferrophilus]|uniref:AsmA family protein n=1 Tax=Desulfovibrio ferrophilus TaxID=241368 RepID=A0A2Z6AV27_9BACT|nr:hypothetical protein [Desulfovibrio ferrophilus]BBD07087.1 uncharacterized protein DFE_0361 [Desulfovibrio ferrophilus]
MKKLIVWGGLGLTLLVAGAIAVTIMSINPLIEKAVNTFGPKLVAAPVHLDTSDVSVFSGEGELRGLFVGNPAGYKSESAFKLGAVRVKVDKESFASDRIVINDITILAPQITYELSGRKSNIQALLDNVNKTAGQEQAAEKQRKKSGQEEPGGGQKIQIDNLLIKGGEITLAITGLGGEVMTVPLPEIHLTDIGKDKDGATPAEAFAQIMAAVNKAVGKAAAGSLGNLTKGLEKSLEDLKNNSGDLKKGVDDLSKGIKGMFQ